MIKNPILEAVTDNIRREAMKEKKLKPFDLEAAKRGEPVVTRVGYPVKIYDFKFNHKRYSLCGKIMFPSRDKSTHWTKEGHYLIDVEDSPYDLFMAPVKKEGWVNIYSKKNHAYAGSIYKTKEEASREKLGNAYVDTVKIEWEE